MEYDFETEYFDIWAIGAEAAWNEVPNVLEGKLYKQSIFTSNPRTAYQSHCSVIVGLESFNVCGN